MMYVEDSVPVVSISLVVDMLVFCKLETVSGMSCSKDSVKHTKKWFLLVESHLRPAALP